MTYDFPTIEEMLEAENERFREAIKEVFNPGMDANSLTGAVMKHLRGQGNPNSAYVLAKEYINNGYKFKGK